MPRLVPYWPMVWRWALLCVALSCGVALLAMAMSATLEKGAPFWAPPLLLAVMIGTIVATLATSDFHFGRGGLKRAIIEPRNVPIVYIVMVGAFGSSKDVYELFEPRVYDKVAEVAKSADVIRNDTAATRVIVERMAATPARSPVLDKLPGHWGEQEPACGVVWDIRIVDDKAMIAEIITRPPGQPPYRLVARIEKTTDDTLHIVGEEPADARGSSAVLRYSSDGITERLVWDDEKRASDLQEYRRCA